MTEMDSMSWLSDYVVHFLKSRVLRASSVWYAPTWITPIAQFVDERCIIFDGACEENKLEYTLCHNEFKQLIDDLFVAHLLEVEITYEQFEFFCQNGLTNNPGLHHLLVTQMLSVDDFLTFKAMMCKRNLDLFSEAMERLQKVEASGAVPPGEETAAAAAALPKAQYNQDVYDSMVQELDEDDPDQRAGESVAMEWRMYEDQLFQAEETRQEGAVAQEEAELEQAIALSLQAEEERIRQLAVEEQAQAAALEASAQEAAAAAAAAQDAAAQELLAQQMAAQQAAAQAQELAAQQAAAQQVQEPSAASTEAPQRAGLPKVVKVKKMKAPTQLAPLAAPRSSNAAAAEIEMRQVLAMQQRARAEAAAAGATPAASEQVLDSTPSPTAAAAPPSEEERQRRAEHLRRTRELLVQKRNEERQRQVGEYRASGGNARAVADRARAGADGNQAGQAMVESLTGQPTGVVQPNEASDAGKAMRQALAAQLRQSLTGAPSDAEQALGRLEHMKQQA